jgi:hypothetical protein
VHDTVARELVFHIRCEDDGGVVSPLSTQEIVDPTTRGSAARHQAGGCAFRFVFGCLVGFAFQGGVRKFRILREDVEVVVRQNSGKVFDTLADTLAGLVGSLAGASGLALVAERQLLLVGLRRVEQLDGGKVSGVVADRGGDVGGDQAFLVLVVVCAQRLRLAGARPG